jgi:hypothetical protein
MSALNLMQTYTAIGPGITASFQAYGGSGSGYVYTVRSGGCGGTIVNDTGIYTAPGSVSENPATISDVIQVRDSSGNIATASILVGTPLLLLCDILQNQLGLDSNHIYVWDQKLFQPTDNLLYIAVSVPNCKPFGNTTEYDANGNSIQSVNMVAEIGIDIISRGPAARDQKELVLMALQSVYSEQQQEANSFQISRLSHSFVNLSEIDGAAIPYRYRIGMNLTYFVKSTQAIPYFNVFSTTQVVVNS